MLQFKKVGVCFVKCSDVDESLIPAFGQTEVALRTRATFILGC